MGKKMRFALLLCLIRVGTAALPLARAAPSTAPQGAISQGAISQGAISQVTVTQYTGSDNAASPAEPIYRIVLRRDGTAVYVGSKIYMKRTGRYHGTIQKRDFERLASLFQANSFQKWRSSYNAYGDRDVASEKFEIVYGDRKKTVLAYSDSGPQAVRRASKIAYGLLWKIQWRRVSASDAMSGEKQRAEMR